MGPQKEMQGDTAARERLMKAATVLFTRKGYAATSVREIVAAAGVTKPVLYYYFGSKEGIYLALMEDAFSRFKALLGEATEIQGGARDKILELLDRVFLLVLEYLDGARLTYSIYFGPHQGEPVFDIDDHYVNFQQIVRKLVEQGMDTGELRKENVDDVTWLLMGAFIVAMQEQLRGTPEFRPGVDRERLRRMVLLILGGLTAKGAWEVRS
jgi:TetR/AcrR family transcriptional regulator